MMFAQVKYAVYVLMVICFFMAGGMDMYCKNYRLGLASILLGIVQILFFLWR